MILNRKDRWVFVSTPKCATHTMYEILPAFGGERFGSGWHLREISIINSRDFFSFTVCRNPYARAVSLWWTTCRPDLDSLWDHYKFRKLVPDYTDFESFMKWLVGLGHISYGQHLAAKLSQTAWQRGMKLNCYLQLENLVEEFNALPFVKEAEAEIITLNESHYLKQDYLEYLTPNAIELVQKWAFADFKRFGYSMKVPHERVKTGT